MARPPSAVPSGQVILSCPYSSPYWPLASTYLLPICPVLAAIRIRPPSVGSSRPATLSSQQFPSHPQQTVVARTPSAVSSGPATLSSQQYPSHPQQTIVARTPSAVSSGQTMHHQ